MNQTNEIPFYSNLPDNTHCLQASFKMALEYFLPDQTFSWEELDEMSGKQAGKGTWTQRILVSVHNIGFDIIYIRPFDAPRFINEGYGYLKEFWSEAAYNWHMRKGAHGVEGAQAAWQDLLNSSITHLSRPSTIHDLKLLLSRGYLTLCGLNGNKLGGEKGYVGHCVLVYSVDKKYVYFHDPGLPAVRARKIPHDTFQLASKEYGYSVVAIRPQKVKSTSNLLY